MTVSVPVISGQLTVESQNVKTFESRIKRGYVWIYNGLFFVFTGNFYFLHGQLDALLCGNSSDSGYVTALTHCVGN